MSLAQTVFFIKNLDTGEYAIPYLDGWVSDLRKAKMYKYASHAKGVITERMCPLRKFDELPKMDYYMCPRRLRKQFPNIAIVTAEVEIREVLVEKVVFAC